MPRPKWKPTEALTPFGRIVRDWMWRQAPPMSVSELGDLAGISKQAVWGWVQHDSLPRRQTIIQLARATGLDADMLLRAAGLPDTRSNDAQRRLQSQMSRLVMKRIVAELDADAQIPRHDRETFKEWLRSHAPLILKGLETAEETASSSLDDPLTLGDGESGEDV